MENSSPQEASVSKSMISVERPADNVIWVTKNYVTNPILSPTYMSTEPGKMIFNTDILKSSFKS
jgi:hypothetical protein